MVPSFQTMIHYLSARETCPDIWQLRRIISENHSGHLTYLPSRVARWNSFKTNIPIWVNFGGPWTGKCGYFLAIRDIFRLFGIFYGHLVMYIVVIWWFFSTFWYFIEENLATLLPRRFSRLRLFKEKSCFAWTQSYNFLNLQLQCRRCSRLERFYFKKYIFALKTHYANYGIVNFYIACVVNIYNATSSVAVRAEKKFYFEKTL
jgi:hypothetical protein